MARFDWMRDEDRQKDLFELIVALGLMIVFFALAVPLLWPLDRLPLASDLAVGFGVLWVVLWITAALVAFLLRRFRIDLYDHSTTYVGVGLTVSALLQVGWSAFAAHTIHGFVAEASFWIAAILHFIGLLSCLVAFFAVSSVYQGAIYRLVSLPLAAVSFLVVSLWPEGAGAICGWFGFS
jgi:hypothetical protein